MRKIIIILLVLFSTLSVKAQVRLDFETGNMAIDVAKGWSFLNINYDKSNNYQIDGNWAGKNTKISVSAEETWMKSPWVKISNGEVSFKIKMDIAKGDTRSYKIYAIPNDTLKANEEGSQILIDQKELTSTKKNEILIIKASLPSKYTGNLYKIKCVFLGQGSGSKTSVDEFIIPGEYFADPANNCLSKKVKADTDNDGIPDENDAFPSDPKRAFKMAFPSASGYGTLAFEDSWPRKADYDFNDVVIDYNLSSTTNAANYLVDITATFKLRASGADFNNGFGFQLDGITPDKIESLTNTYTIENPNFNYEVAANNLEKGQQYATCVVFNDFHKIMKNASSENLVNTLNKLDKVEEKTIVVKINFAPNEVSSNQVNANTFNYFIIPNLMKSDNNLRTEIHLPNRKPTSKAELKYFGKMDDASNGSTVYYKSINNLPWAINVVQNFKYPTEKTPLNEAYPHLIRWAETGGVEFPDWYDSSKAGYSNPTKLYNK